MSQDLKEIEQPTFVEAALTLGGKSAEEARRTGSLDRADDQVEYLFAARHQTNQSPVHRAVWDRDFPTELFAPEPTPTPPACERTMQASLDLVRRHVAAKTLLNDQGKIADPVFRELGEVGYWGLLVDPEYGGGGAPFSAFAPFLTRMATIDPTVDTTRTDVSRKTLVDYISDSLTNIAKVQTKRQGTTKRRDNLKDTFDGFITKLLGDTVAQFVTSYTTDGQPVHVVRYDFSINPIQSDDVIVFNMRVGPNAVAVSKG